MQAAEEAGASGQAAGAAGGSGQAAGAASGSGQAARAAGGSGQAAETAACIEYSAGRKGQVVSAMIGALAYNNYPVAVDLTDGEVHHILQLRGAQLYTWTNLTPSQV